MATFARNADYFCECCDLTIFCDNVLMTGETVPMIVEQLLKQEVLPKPPEVEADSSRILQICHCHYSLDGDGYCFRKVTLSAAF